MLLKEDIQSKNLQTFEDESRILLQGNNYVDLLPHADLKYYISFYTVTFPRYEDQPDYYPIVPHIGGMLFVANEQVGMSATLYGTLQSRSNVDHITGLLVIIFFEPLGLYALTGINQDELTSQNFPLVDLAPKLNKQVAEITENASTLYELMTSLDTVMLANMSKPYPPVLNSSTRNVINCLGNTTVKKVSADMNYSDRQLNRIFEKYIGVSIKSFLRLVRVANAFHLLEKSNDSLTFISETLGFYNLSHFVQDFKSLSGLTPQQYRNVMNDFYMEQETVLDKDS